MTLWQHVSEPYAPKRPAKNYRECYHRRTERIHRFAPGSLKASIIVERHVPKVGNSPIADRSRARYERLAGAQAFDEIGEAGLASISREQPTTSAKRMAASRHSRWSLRRGAVVTLTTAIPTGALSSMPEQAIRAARTQALRRYRLGPRSLLVV